MSGHKADWLTVEEMEHIAGMIRAINTVDESVVSFGQIPVMDANGEPLGHIESVLGSARFVPTGWRTDD